MSNHPQCQLRLVRGCCFWGVFSSLSADTGKHWVPVQQLSKMWIQLGSASKGNAYIASRSFFAKSMVQSGELMIICGLGHQRELAREQVTQRPGGQFPVFALESGHLHAQQYACSQWLVLNICIFGCSEGSASALLNVLWVGSRWTYSLSYRHWCSSQFDLFPCISNPICEGTVRVRRLTCKCFAMCGKNSWVDLAQLEQE